MKHTVQTLSLLVFLFLSSSVHAITLDWDQVNWTPGNTTQTFTNVDGSDIDITIALSLSYDWERHSNGYRSYWTQTDWLTNAPDDNNTFDGDENTIGDESLYLGVNFASDDRFQSYLDVTITFSQAVNDANFSIFDVDAYGYNYTGGYETGIQFIDIIENVQGSLNGASVAGTVTHDSSKILEMSDANGTYYQGNTDLVNINDQADNSRSVLNLGWNNSVDTISFRYTTARGAVADPGNQAIGLSGIGFSEYCAVPEPSTYLAALLIPLAGFIAYRRKKAQKSRS